LLLTLSDYDYWLLNLNIISPKVLVCNPGTLHSFSLAKELLLQRIDVVYATSLFIPQWVNRILPRKLRGKLTNRMEPALDGHVCQYPVPEIIYLLWMRFFPRHGGRLIRWRNRLFGQWLIRNKLKGVEVVWSFDTASEEIFRYAKKAGVKCILDMSTGHPVAGEAVLGAHAKMCPQFWEHGDIERKDDWELQSRENEMLLADVIVAASSYAAYSIREKLPVNSLIREIPYGCDLSFFSPRAMRDGGSTVKYLFVGWFGQQKGVYDLLRAWDKCNLSERARLLMAGGRRVDLKCWPGEMPKGVKCLGRISKRDIADLYRSSDVFVFPSLFEGFGLVILEAMASGLPVITTTNTAGPDLIDDGVEGYIVEPGDVEALARYMRLLAVDVDLREWMGRKAREKAERYTWEEYGRKCAELCRGIARES
jgi:glycosyltransferase involved in cell wall biosynthesis